MSSENSKSLLRAEHISKAYGEKQVLKDITDTVILRASTSYGSGRFRVKKEYL